MKSIIDQDNIKNIIMKTVEKALKECAIQHNYNIEDNIEPYSNSQPNKLKLTLEFNFNDEKRGCIICQPIVYLCNNKD